MKADSFTKLGILLLAIGIVIVAVQTEADAQKMTERTLTCTTPDSNHEKCVTIYQPAVSGGGKNFGPYWDAVAVAPDGYTTESVEFHLTGPHPCDGDLNSTFIPVDKAEADKRAQLHVAWLPGNPDSQWKGHPNGKGAWAVCYIADLNGRVYWRYAIQGIEAHGISGSDKIPDIGTFPKWNYVGDQQIAEGAELIAVYAKIPPPAATWPQAHKVVKGDSLTLIAQAAYGKPNWWKIYAANKGKIGDADTIFPGEELTIPAP